MNRSEDDLPLSRYGMAQLKSEVVAAVEQKLRKRSPIVLWNLDGSLTTKELEAARRESGGVQAILIVEYEGGEPSRDFQGIP